MNLKKINAYKVINKNQDYSIFYIEPTNGGKWTKTIVDSTYNYCVAVFATEKEASDLDCILNKNKG